MLVCTVRWKSATNRTGWTVMRYAGSSGLLAPTVVARSRAFFNMGIVRTFIPNEFRFEFGDPRPTNPSIWDQRIEIRDDVTDAILTTVNVPNVGSPITATNALPWRDGIGCRVMLETGFRGGHGLVVGHWKLVPYVMSSGTGAPNNATLASLSSNVESWRVATLAAGLVPVVYRRQTTAGGGNVRQVTKMSVRPGEWTQMTRRRRRRPGPPPQPPLP